ncbi:hypothetical protein BH23ACT12_BH23ACT12_20910 [soil metagenome]
MLRPQLCRISAAAIVLLFVLLGAPSAVAQSCEPVCEAFPDTGQNEGGSVPDTGGGGGPPGAAGSPGSDSADGQNAPAQPGTSQAGQPGQAGRPTPPAPPPPSRTTTSTTRRTTSSTNRSTTASSTPDPLLVTPTPEVSPTPSPTPSESPSPTPSPSDLVTALDDADPTAGDGSLVPFFALVAGAILLFIYVRSRRPRRGMRSVGSRHGGNHSF